MYSRNRDHKLFLSLTITVHHIFWHFLCNSVFSSGNILSTTCDLLRESQCSSVAVVISTLKVVQYDRCFSRQSAELNRSFVVKDSSRKRGQLHLRLLLGLISGRLTSEEGRQPRVRTEDRVNKLQISTVHPQTNCSRKFGQLTLGAWI